MAILHILTIILFFFAVVILLLFKIYNSKKYYIDTIIIILIIILSFESSLLNGPLVAKVFKQKCEEYIREINTIYPVSDSTQIPTEYFELSTIVEKMSLLKSSDNNKVAILQNGESTYSAIFAEMNNAKNHIHIEDFIIRDDEVGKKFQEILINKASEGVKVRLLVDGLGFKLKMSSIRKLKKSGVQIFIKGSILKSLFQGDFNYRDHRKIYIVDGKTAFTGGVNIGNEYLGQNPDIGNWRDTDIMLTGDSARQLQSVFLSSWYAYTDQKLVDPVYYPMVETNTKQTVQIVIGYPVEDNPIEYTYFNLINSARKNIFIETPYLTLDSTLFHSLTSAALRGIDVTIIIPSKPDEKTAYYSTLQNADRLANFGVKIYKHHSIIHSKLIIVDSAVVSLGTVNFNNRSMHLDYEDSVLIYDKTIVNSLNNGFNNDLINSKLYSPFDNAPKGVIDAIYKKIAILISPVL